MNNDELKRMLEDESPDIELKKPPNGFKLSLTNGRVTLVRRPTRSLRAWLSGKSRVHNDITVQRMLPNIRVGDLRAYRLGDRFPNGVHLKEMSIYFGFPTDDLSSYLVARKAKINKKMFKAVGLNGETTIGKKLVLAIVPAHFAERYSWPTFELRGRAANEGHVTDEFVELCEGESGSDDTGDERDRHSGPRPSSDVLA